MRRNNAIHTAAIQQPHFVSIKFLGKHCAKRALDHPFNRLNVRRFEILACSDRPDRFIGNNQITLRQAVHVAQGGLKLIYYHRL